MRRWEGHHNLSPSPPTITPLPGDKLHEVIRQSNSLPDRPILASAISQGKEPRAGGRDAWRLTALASKMEEYGLEMKSEDTTCSSV